MAQKAVSEKETIETRAIAQFISLLFATRGITYKQTGREVPINSAGTNYDFELTPDDPSRPRMAVEIFRLFESPQAAEAERHLGRYWAELQKELEAAGVGPVLVSFPRQSAPVPRDANTKARAVAQRVKAALSSRATTPTAAAPAPPDEEDDSLKVDELRVVPIDGLTRPALSTLPDFSYGNALNRGVGELAKNLTKKNNQLAVPDHERVVLIVNSALLVDAEDCVRVLATSDTSHLDNIDGIYFWCPNRGHQLVYERSVRDAFTSAVLHHGDNSDLIEQWLTAKLDARLDDAVVLARRHTDRVGSLTWLRPQARALLIHRIGQLVERQLAGTGT